MWFAFYSLTHDLVDNILLYGINFCFVERLSPHLEITRITQTIVKCMLIHNWDFKNSANDDKGKGKLNLLRLNVCLFFGQILPSCPSSVPPVQTPCQKTLRICARHNCYSFSRPSSAPWHHLHHHHLMLSWYTWALIALIFSILSLCIFICPHVCSSISELLRRVDGHQQSGEVFHHLAKGQPGERRKT